MSAPPLSVVMPVHNALPFLDEAVASILRQSFGDFELVILDDGSTDGSAEALRGWAQRDARIRLVRNDERLGPVGSSDRVCREARGAILARMDADDVAHPDRLRRQMAVLGARADAVLVASLHDTIDAQGRPLRPGDLGRLLRRSWFAPFVHGSATFRRAAFEAAGGYRSGSEYWEDIDLFLRLAKIGRMLVIPETLYSHRISAASTRLASRSEAVARAYTRMYVALGGAGTGAAPRRGIVPAAIPLLGSVPLLGGERPGLLPLLLREGRLSADPGTARALAWAAWADTSPRSLRLMLRLLLARRNRRAARHVEGRPWVEWRPSHPEPAPSS